MDGTNGTKSVSDGDGSGSGGLTLDFHLLGVVEYPRWQALQQRLVAAAGDGLARSIPIVLCEHPATITIGRSGSRAHIRLTNEQLERRQIPVHWVGRGGGCLLHLPGQLGIYPVVPLAEVGWTVGEYTRRLQRSVLSAIRQLPLPASDRPDRWGVWGPTGLVAALGLRFQGWVAHYGVSLNVCPDMSLFGYIDTATGDPAGSSGADAAPMSSLLVERRGPVKMASVRTTMIEAIAEVWGATRYHIHAGHPWLAESPDVRRRREWA